MVQFCYLRLYLLKLFPVVCCKGWQGWTWIETLKSFNAMLAKIIRKYYR